MANPILEHIHRDGKTYDLKDMYAERSANKTTEIRQNPDNTHFPSEKAVADALAPKESSGNKVSSWSAAPDNGHYPSEKLVKDSIDSVDRKKEDTSNKVSAWSESPADTRYPSEKLVKDGFDAVRKEIQDAKEESGGWLGDKEDKSNKVISFRPTPSDTAYPSEKLVKDSLDAVNLRIDNINPVTSVVVSALPAVSDAKVGFDYFLKQGNGVLLYKVIDGAWKMVGGEKRHFSMTANDQMNLQAAAIQILNGASAIPYHADGGEFKGYSADDMLTIISASNDHKSYHLAYLNSAKKWVNALRRVASVRAVEYGAEIPQKYQSAYLKSRVQG